MRYPDLPFHFVWRSSGATDTLKGALQTIETAPDDVAWHLAEGHLQVALRDQGYGVLADGITGPEHADLLRERTRVALEMHRRYWDEQDDLGQAVCNLARIFRTRGSGLLEQGKKRVATWMASRK